jgi:hypothetical protein
MILNNHIRPWLLVFRRLLLLENPALEEETSCKAIKKSSNI